MADVCKADPGQKKSPSLMMQLRVNPIQGSVFMAGLAAVSFAVYFSEPTLSLVSV